MTQTILYTVAPPTRELSSLISKKYANTYWINNHTNFEDTINSLATIEEINEDANQLIKKELEKMMNKNCEELSAMTCFVLLPEPDSCFYHIAWLNKIIEKKPNQQITCLVQDFRTYYFLNKTFNKNPIVNVIYNKKNIQEFILVNLPGIFFYFFVMSFTSLRIFTQWCKYQFEKVNQYKLGKILFINSTEKNFFHRGESHMDFILIDLFQELSDSQKGALTLHRHGHYSFLKYLSFKKLMMVFISSLFKLCKGIKRIDKRYKCFWGVMFSALVYQAGLKHIIKQFEISKVIYQDEVFSFGRLIALACQNSNIETIGVQHAMIAKAHPTYKFFNLYNEYPQLFPKKMLVYGSVVANLLANRGYPRSQLHEIGSKRIYNSTKIEPNNLRKQKKYDLLYLSPKIIYELQQVLPEFGSKRILIRQHPNYHSVCMFDDISIDEFKNEYPNIDVENSKDVSMKDSLQSVDIVFSKAHTTAFFDAVLSEKVCVLLTTKELGDYYDLGKWGVQVVHDLKNVDWTKRADPTRLIEELKPKRFFQKNSASLNKVTK